MSEHDIFDYIDLAQNGDEKAKEICVERNLGLVWSIVNRFSRQNSAQDLFQIGCIGLMKAINHFDRSYNVMFSTYAVPIILGEIKRFFRDDGSIKVSRSLKERYLQVLKVKEVLAQTNQQEPTYREIAQAMNLDEYDVMLAFEANQFLASMDEEFQQKDGSTLTLVDKVESKSLGDIPLKIALKQEIAQLEQRERLLLYLRYDCELNQQKVAERMGISQVQVSRAEKKILAKLKDKLYTLD